MDNKKFKSKIMVLKKNALAQHMEPKFYDFLPEDFYQINKDQLMYMWHFLSDKDIAELYDIPAKKVKNRRHDFNIKPVTSAIDRIERELYGREDWIEEELKSVLPFEYNNANIPHTNSTPLNSEKEFLYMKATGIVRRIDDLGRIVIPKEIRRTMRIREGDPMEIFTSREGEILLKKYSPVGELSEFAGALAESMAQTLGALVCVTDRDYVIAAAGAGKKEFEGKNLDERLQAAIEQRVYRVSEKEQKEYIRIVQEGENDYERQAIATILSHGDCIGAVVVLCKENSGNSDEALLQVAKTAAGFVGKHMEQ